MAQKRRRMTKRQALREDWFMFAILIAVVLAIGAAIYFWWTGQIGHDVPAA
jgi:cytoskeletal protein RodZ